MTRVQFKEEKSNNSSDNGQAEANTNTHEIKKYSIEKKYETFEDVPVIYRSDWMYDVKQLVDILKIYYTENKEYADLRFEVEDKKEVLEYIQRYRLLGIDNYILNKETIVVLDIDTGGLKVISTDRLMPLELTKSSFWANYCNTIDYSNIDLKRVIQLPCRREQTEKIVNGGNLHLEYIYSQDVFLDSSREQWKVDKNTLDNQEILFKKCKTPRNKFKVQLDDKRKRELEKVLLNTIAFNQYNAESRAVVRCINNRNEVVARIGIDLTVALCIKTEQSEINELLSRDNTYTIDIDEYGKREIQKTLKLSETLEELGDKNIREKGKSIVFELSDNYNMLIVIDLFQEISVDDDGQRVIFKVHIDDIEESLKIMRASIALARYIMVWRGLSVNASNLSLIQI